jgi:hypothetical protein
MVLRVMSKNVTINSVNLGKQKATMDPWRRLIMI